MKIITRPEIKQRCDSALNAWNFFCEIVETVCFEIQTLNPGLVQDGDNWLPKPETPEEEQERFRKTANAWVALCGYLAIVLAHVEDAAFQAVVPRMRLVLHLAGTQGISDPDVRKMIQETIAALPGIT